MPHSRVVGLEMQRDLVRLAGDNAILNAMEARVSVMIGDLLRPPPRLSPGAFDHVMANPPYNERRRTAPAMTPGRADATVESDADLAAWVRFALAMVRPKGSVTFVHRVPTASTRCWGKFRGRAGEVVVFPLWAGEDRPASRILVRVPNRSRLRRLAPGRPCIGPTAGWRSRRGRVARGARARSLIEQGHSVQ